MPEIENKPAIEILKLAILSHYCETKEDKSVSVILIADPELDKTRTLKRCRNARGVSTQTDLTYMGIINHILPKIEREEIKTLVIPDMLKTIMKKEATKDNFIGILNSIICEGVREITLRDTRDYNGARCNLLTSIVPSMFFNNKLKWNKIGFLSRLLPFTYSYSETKRERIIDAITKGDIEEPEPIELPKVEFRTDVHLPSEIARKAIQLAAPLLESERARYTTKSGEIEHTRKGEGYRHQHQFQSLLRASVLLREDRDLTVKDEDFDKLKHLSRWINYDFNVI